MQVTDVRAVIAIGLSGQFGLHGRLPWEGNRGREYVADVERFFELMRGHVLIAGHRTLTSVPDFAFQNPDIVEVHASDAPEDVLVRRMGQWRPAICPRRAPKDEIEVALAVQMACTDSRDGSPRQVGCRLWD